MHPTTLDLIRAWAHDRNLIDGSTPQAQVLKLGEEFGEFCAALARKQHEQICDGAGDMVVVLTIIMAQLGVNLEDCIAQAYHEIKDRKGRMVDGVFVKEVCA